MNRVTEQLEQYTNQIEQQIALWDTWQTYNDSDNDDLWDFGLDDFQW